MNAYFKQLKVLSASTIKIIACIAMFLDHINCALWTRYSGYVLTLPYEKIMFYKRLNTIIDRIGDLAFPLFCFMLIEGFQHTRSVKKYLTRLLIFALISEVPFDLTFYGELIHAAHQNTLFTLFIGLLVVSIINSLFLADNLNYILRSLLMATVIGCGCLAARMLNVDYSFYGIVTIVILYFLRFDRRLQLFGGAMSFTYKLSAIPAFLILLMYNQKRGLKLKYIFYAFYPLHLLIIYLIATYAVPLLI